MDSLLPARRKVMRLEVGQPQTVALKERLKQVMPCAQFRGNLVNNVDVLRVSCEVAAEDQGDGAADEQSRRLGDVLGELTEELQDVIGFDRVHDSPLKGGETEIVRGFKGVSDAAQHLPPRRSAQPFVKPLRPPMRFEGAQA